MMRILYDSQKTEYKSPFGALRQNQPCTISVKIPLHCATSAVQVCLQHDQTGCEVRFSLAPQQTADGYETYSGEITLSQTGLYFYHFWIQTAQSEFNLYRHDYHQTNIGVGDCWQLTCYDETFTVPDRFCGKVMYQIFPDRFYHEQLEPATDKLEPYSIHQNMRDIPDYLPNENGEITNSDFYGGNLKGIMKKLDYLKSLGVSIVYLNPIFMAYSNHRYDTCDYKRIDPLLGDEADFVQLCQQAHARGIKIILDGVFSHTGSNSIYFDKHAVFGTGAYSNPNSLYYDWYRFGDNRDQYDAWWGIGTLPCVNELCPSYMDYIIHAEDSVLAHWLRLGADGFRLDVADELPDEFIKALRTRVKEIKPESYVVGEVWEDASNKISYGKRRTYFSNAELDSVMNYVFKDAIIGYSKRQLSACDFARQVMTIVENYPSAAVHSLMNSLSTHDTARILTCLSDAQDSMDKMQKAQYRLSSEQRDQAKNRLYVASLLQFMLPGNACIYYGDEIGMEGFGDPFNRGYFWWDAMDAQLLAFFKALGEIKNTCSALQTGDIRFVQTDDVLVFERYDVTQIVTVVINQSDTAYPLPDGEILLFHNASGSQSQCCVQKHGFAVVVRSIV